jgi:hypothetical protein
MFMFFVFLRGRQRLVYISLERHTEKEKNGYVVF